VLSAKYYLGSSNAHNGVYGVAWTCDMPCLMHVSGDSSCDTEGS